MYDSVVFEDLFLIRFVPDQYKTQQMCDKAVDDCLAGMKLVPDLFATSQMILFTTLYADENILFFNEDYGNVAFSCNEMGILNKALKNVNLDDISYEEDDPDTIVFVRLLALHIKFGKLEAFKKELKE